MAEVVVKKSNKLGARIWLSIVLFGLMGQLAWMVENMYFSTYIQKRITDNPIGTSATVAASAVVAALVTIFGGVLSDRLGKRKVFISWGYIVWGLVTASFGFFGHNQVAAQNIILVLTLFVIMDCVMTVFGHRCHRYYQSRFCGCDIVHYARCGNDDNICRFRTVGRRGKCRRGKVGVVLRIAWRHNRSFGSFGFVLAQRQPAPQTGQIR